MAAFCLDGNADDVDIDGSRLTFLHTGIRLFSMLSACALQELSPRKSHKIWGLLTLDADAIDAYSLATLDGSTRRVDLCYHWLQQLLIQGHRKGLLDSPPPIVSRTFTELSSGMSKFADAKKHAHCQFNFPYAQAMKWLVILYSVLTPFMMVQWSKREIGAFIFTFIQLFFVWSLTFITEILESPFDTANSNCIDVYSLQHDMNTSLLVFMDPRTCHGPPTIEKLDSMTYNQLQQRDTAHKAALVKEGWQLKGISAMTLSAGRLTQTTRELGCLRHCCLCCCSRNPPLEEIAVSREFCTKRYGVVDNEKTAVIPVGICGTELIIACPPSCKTTLGAAMLEVESKEGHMVQLYFKKVAIKDRHKLLTTVAWEAGECTDFHYEYADLVTPVLQAGSKVLSSVSLSHVTQEADMLAHRRMLEAREADKRDFGIDQMVHLKTHNDFVNLLMDQCSLTEADAHAEWERRVNTLEKFQDAIGDDGELMIELDIKAFKQQLQEKQAEEEKKTKMYQQSHDALKSALDAGKVAGLEDAIKKADIGLNVWFPEEELIKARETCLSWQRLEDQLQHACEQPGFEELQSAIVAAADYDPPYCGELRSQAEKLLNQRTAESRKRVRVSVVALKDGVTSDSIRELASALKQAENAGLDDSDIEAARDRLEAVMEEREEQRLEEQRLEEIARSEQQRLDEGTQILESQESISDAERGSDQHTGYEELPCSEEHGSAKAEQKCDTAEGQDVDVSLDVLKDAVNDNGVRRMSRSRAMSLSPNLGDSQPTEHDLEAVLNEVESRLDEEQGLASVDKEDHSSTVSDLDKLLAMEAGKRSSDLALPGSLQTEDMNGTA
eukprot:TRINITY_DN29571_c0_g1_i1.p1 TRINITY_DN29571_c0_g1~~TRINITY_DN29571_c0_g1_i1.p1  ORF type:complete len:953 (-),score=198.20 TRINITY_DN29571_c0_g1_i1:82-2598(-)